MAEVIFREFRPGDLDALFVLDFRCYPEPYRFGYQQLLVTLQDRQVSAMVIEAERKGDLAGALIVRADEAARQAAVVSLMVEPDYRRHGLGTRLLDWSRRYVLAASWERLIVPLERTNEGAAAFLAAAGLENSGLNEPYFRTPEEGTLWRLNLDGEASP